MIQANELRIGNLVTTTLGISPVVQIREDGVFVSIQMNEEYFQFERLDPIPITPEILEKCGFVEKRKNAWYNGRLQWNGHLVYLKNEDTEECYYIPTIVDYLHQLQNLYYAITGTELNVQL